MTLSFWSSYLHCLNTGIIGVHCHILFYSVLRVESRTARIPLHTLVVSWQSLSLGSPTLHPISPFFDLNWKYSQGWSLLSLFFSRFSCWYGSWGSSNPEFFCCSHLSAEVSTLGFRPGCYQDLLVRLRKVSPSLHIVRPTWNLKQIYQFCNLSFMCCSCLSSTPLIRRL